MTIEDVKEECDFVVNQQDRVFAQKMARALKVAIAAMQKECDNFRFPDEDRPIIHGALEEIITEFKKPF